jgi:hypothetical protein
MPSQLPPSFTLDLVQKGINRQIEELTTKATLRIDGPSECALGVLNDQLWGSLIPSPFVFN